jgi:hypothetical protein
MNFTARQATGPELQDMNYRIWSVNSPQPMLVHS